MAFTSTRANELQQLLTNAKRVHADERRVYTAQHKADETTIKELTDLVGEKTEQITVQGDRLTGFVNQAESVVKLRNEDATKINNMQEKNDNQAGIIVELREMLGVTGYTDKDEQIVALGRRITHLQNASQDKSAQLVAIGMTANQLAEDNGWCDEYDSLVTEVNEALDKLEGEFRLPDRTKNYYVTLSLNVYVENAKDEDIATEMAIDQLNSGSLDEAELDRYNISIEEEE